MSERTKYEEALEILKGKTKNMASLMDAVYILRGDKTSPPLDLLYGFNHPGIIAEHTAFSLYEKTGRLLPHPKEGEMMELDKDPESWRKWLEESPNMRNRFGSEHIGKIAKLNLRPSYKPELSEFLEAIGGHEVIQGEIMEIGEEYVRINDSGGARPKIFSICSTSRGIKGTGVRNIPYQDIISLKFLQ